MLGRRTLLLNIVAGAMTAGSWLVSRSASAQAPEVGTKLRLRIAAVDGARRDNCSFMKHAEAELADEIARGAVPISAQKTVVCPLCRETITLIASETIAG